MAEMTGVHVEMGVAVKVGKSETLFYGLWSETIALGAKTTQAATSADSTLRDATEGGILVFRVRAQSAGAVYVAHGPTAIVDASKAISTGGASVRSHLIASESRDIPCKIGDVLATITAS